MKISTQLAQGIRRYSRTSPNACGGKLTDVGLAVDASEPAGDDPVFELDVATNRPDCLSHLGVAREAERDLRLLPLRHAKDSICAKRGKHAEDVFSISIADPDLCARYCGRYIAGVRIGPSPDWLKTRLEALGVRSINNVADVTNYVMLELGQPLHAFDADTLEGRQIIVRRAELDEKMTTLDGVERNLNPSMLVIADAERAVAIAGVMGGAETEISSSTTNVLLESANFNPLSIRKTSRALGFHTEASYRFERGADIEMARYACDRAAALDSATGRREIYRDVIDVYPRPDSDCHSLQLRRYRIQAFLGAPSMTHIVERIFSSSGSERRRYGRRLDPSKCPAIESDIGHRRGSARRNRTPSRIRQVSGDLPAWAGYGSGSAV